MALSPNELAELAPHPASRPAPRGGILSKPGPWVELGLTLPIFVAYHAGVVFLRVRNGTDLVTGELLQLAEGSRGVYLLFTAAIGVVFAGIFAWLGRGQAFRTSKFIQMAVEGAAYAVLMRAGGAYVVSRIFAGKGIQGQNPFVGVVMSLGAGFYEELVFRVLLFGLGAKALVWVFASERLRLFNGQSRLSLRAVFLTVVWSAVSAATFSAVHYVGPLADTFAWTSFTFRFVLGMSLTLVFAFRGFAAAVWTHALYDIWVLVF